MNEETRIAGKSGDKGEIYELQRYLRYIARYVSEVPSVTPDGVYGKETSQAVLAFQRKYGLRPTGEVDYETWTEIVRIYDDLNRKNGTPQPVYVYPLEAPYLSEGDVLEEIFILQHMLRRLSGIYENLAGAELTGEFDKKTTKAVNDFKRSRGNTEDGRVDRETWNDIADVYNAFRFNE